MLGICIYQHQQWFSCSVVVILCTVLKHRYLYTTSSHTIYVEAPCALTPDGPNGRSDKCVCIDNMAFSYLEQNEPFAQSKRADGFLK